MIITPQPKAGGFKLPKIVWKLFLGLLVGGLVVLFIQYLGLNVGFNDSNTTTSTTTFFCDAESTVREDNILYFHGEGTLFGGGQQQTSTEAFEGTYSCKINSDGKYGFSRKITNVQKGDNVSVKVWVKCPSSFNPKIVVESDFGDYIADGRFIETKGDWQLLSLKYEVSEKATNDQHSIKIYVTSFNEQHTGYFDNFEITYNGVGKRTVEPIKSLNLHISKNGLQKLKNKRTEALKRGLLVTADDDWVKGEIWENDKKIPVKLRLKGDWLDHLKSDKWSFRIKCSGEKTWNRLATFSIQSPHTRNFLTEWVYHDLLQKESILSPRYDFIRVSINGKMKGIYAVEEHFVKQLPEYQERREGPILKLDESIMWAMRRRAMDAGEPINWMEGRLKTGRLSYQNAEIAPFSGGKTGKTEKLRIAYEEGRNKLYGFTLDSLATSDVFDIDRIAMHYAMIELTGAYHNAIWHNTRYYYNPVTTLLEPIGYDGFTEHGSDYWFPEGVFASQKKYFTDDYSGSGFFTNLQKDTAYLAAYIKALQKVSAPTYLPAHMESIDEDIFTKQSWIRQNYPNYTFNYSAWLTRATAIRLLLEPDPALSLVAYKDGNNISVANKHQLPLQVVGLGDKNAVIEAKNVILKPKFVNEPLHHQVISADQPYSHIYFKLPGIGTVNSLPIAQWKAPSIQLSSLQTMKTIAPVSNEFYLVKGKHIIFEKGPVTISESIVIPAGYKVFFMAGTEITFNQKAAFISYSPVFMNGTSDHMIKIHSDGTGQGFTVLASESSVMHFVDFNGLNTLNQENWLLTGAVTFYESDVDILNCNFNNNSCEDALNLVRSTFTMKGATFVSTFGDAFDADFCSGTVDGCFFKNTGNDAMDFSGSKIKIINTVVDGSGDKGISAGEQAYLTVNNSKISNAIIGVASKDLSEVTIGSIEITNSDQAFAAYQKKPEFGPAKITVKNLTQGNNKRLKAIEEGSSCVIDNM